MSEEMTYLAPEPGARGATGPSRSLRSTIRDLAPSLVVAGALVYAYWPTLVDLVRVWRREPDYSHGFLVLPIALVILHQLWPKDPARGARVWYPGLIVVAAGLGLRAWFLSRASFWSTNATLLITIAGLGLSRLGLRAMRSTWPAFAFLIFLLPLPPTLNNTLSQPLQGLATVVTCRVLSLAGLWVLNEGNVIIVGGEPLEVAEACNGLSMLMSLAATVAAAVALIPLAPIKKLFLLASIIPIALLSNVLRISATAWCYHSYGAKIGGEWAHDLAGYLMMPLALLFVGLEVLILSWIFVETPAEDYIPVRPGFTDTTRRNPSGVGL